MNTTIAITVAAAVLGCGGGCSEPFQREPLQTLGTVRPPELLQTAQRNVPPRMTSEDRVIIQSLIGDQAIMGVVNVNRTTGTFELAGLNHMGLVLFDVSGDRRRTTIKSAIPPLDKMPQVLHALARDIRNIYLDPVPHDAADANASSKSVCYHQTTPQGTIHYELAAPDGRLIEKRLTSTGRTLWRIRYYGYTAKSGVIHAGGIVLDNNTYHYRVVIRNRSWQIGDAGETGNE